MPNQFGFVPEPQAVPLLDMDDFGFVPEDVPAPRPGVNDLEISLRKEQEEKERARLQAQQQQELARRQQEDPRNWTYEETVKRYKQTPPADDQEAAVRQIDLEHKKALNDARKSILTNMIKGTAADITAIPYRMLLGTRAPSEGMFFKDQKSAQEWLSEEVGTQDVAAKWDQKKGWITKPVPVQRWEAMVDQGVDIASLGLIGYAAFQTIASTPQAQLAMSKIATKNVLRQVPQDTLKEVVRKITIGQPLTTQQEKIYRTFNKDITQISRAWRQGAVSSTVPRKGFEWLAQMLGVTPQQSAAKAQGQADAFGQEKLMYFGAGAAPQRLPQNGEMVKIGNEAYRVLSITGNTAQLVSMTGDKISAALDKIKPPDIQATEEIQRLMKEIQRNNEHMVEQVKAAGGAPEMLEAVKDTPLGIRTQKLQRKAEALESAVEVYSKSLPQQANLDAIANEALKQSGVDGNYSGHAKSPQSLADKVIRKNDPNYDAWSAKDHARGRIIVDDLTQSPQIIDALQTQRPVSLDIKTGEEQFFGYRGIFVTTKLDNGVNGEIQIHNADSWKLKEASDLVYRDWRKFIDGREYNIPEAKRGEFFKTMQEWVGKWNSWYAGLSQEERDAISSLEAGRPSMISPSVPSNLVQEPSGNRTLAQSPVRIPEISTNLPEESRTNVDTGIQGSAADVGLGIVTPPSRETLPQVEGDVNREVSPGDARDTDAGELMKAYDDLTPEDRARMELEMDDLRKTPEGNLLVAVRQLGKISPYKKGFLAEELRAIPASLKDKSSKHTLDTIVSELSTFGWRFEDAEELREAIIDAAKTQEGPVNRQQLRAIIREAEKNKKLQAAILEKLGKKVRKFPETVRKADKTDPEFKKKITKQYYDPLSNKESLAQAQAVLQSNPDAALETVFEAGAPTTLSNTLGILLLDKYQAAGQWEEAKRLLDHMAERNTRAGQAIQALSMYARLSPEGVLQYAHKQVKAAREQVNKEKVSKFEQIVKGLSGDADREKLAKKMGVPYLDEAAMKDLKGMAAEIQKMVPGRDRDIKAAMMMKRIAQLIPRSLGEKVSLLQTMAQLLNPKTIVRNLLGNAGFQVAENAADSVGTVLDIATSFLTGKRTQTLPSVPAQARGFAQGMKQGVEEALLGIDTSRVQTKYDLPKAGIFENPVLKAFETTLNLVLRAPDRAAYQSAFNQEILNQVRAAQANKVSLPLDPMGMPEPTAEMIERAHFIGLYRTFQDDNVVSEIFVRMKKLLNLVSPFKDKKWGLGDIVLKYPKTPGNLLARGLEYTPLEFLNTVRYLAEPLFGEPFNQAEFVRKTSRGLTGSAFLFGAGALLAKLWIIRGKRSKDYDKAATEANVGLREYQINTSALKRFVASGFDPELAKMQEDDQLVSYDWFLPASLSIALGANMVIADKPVVDRALNLFESAMSASETLTEQPLVRGIKTLTRKENIGEGISDVVQDIPASFVPTLLNQVRQLTDNTVRNTRDPNYWKEIYNKAVYRVPGMSKDLPPRITTLGEVQEMYQGGTNNPFNVFLNPAFVNKYRPDPVSKLVLDLWQETGETVQFPRLAQGKVKLGGVRPGEIELDAWTFARYQKYVGTKTNILFSILKDSPDYMAMSGEDQAQKLQKYLTDINTAAKIEILGYEPSRKISQSVESIITDIAVDLDELKKASSLPAQSTPDEDFGFVEE